jgi:hypothetical protein
MPKLITPAMRAHLDAETTRLAAIWRITRQDGQQFFFTDHDRDIVFGGDTYRGDAGFERTAIRSDALAHIVTALCLRAGLGEADLDVSQLTHGVRGYALARQISVRGALEMLAAAYMFDAVESDHELKFKKRGREPSRVIPEQDLVPVNAEREAFIETRAQELDLPVRFTVVCQDLEREADIGTQYAKRVAGPPAAPCTRATRRPSICRSRSRPRRPRPSRSASCAALGLSAPATSGTCPGPTSTSSRPTSCRSPSMTARS